MRFYLFYVGFSLVLFYKLADGPGGWEYALSIRRFIFSVLHSSIPRLFVS